MVHRQLVELLSITPGLLDGVLRSAAAGADIHQLPVHIDDVEALGYHDLLQELLRGPLTADMVANKAAQDLLAGAGHRVAPYICVNLVGLRQRIAAPKRTCDVLVWMVARSPSWAVMSGIVARFDVAEGQQVPTTFLLRPFVTSSCCPLAAAAISVCLQRIPASVRAAVVIPGSAVEICGTFVMDTTQPHFTASSVSPVFAKVTTTLAQPLLHLPQLSAAVDEEAAFRRCRLMWDALRCSAGPLSLRDLSTDPLARLLADADDERRARVPLEAALSAWIVVAWSFAVSDGPVLLGVVAPTECISTLIAQIKATLPVAKVHHLCDAASARAASVLPTATKGDATISSVGVRPPQQQRRCESFAAGQLSRGCQPLLLMSHVTMARRDATTVVDALLGGSVEIGAELPRQCLLSNAALLFTCDTALTRVVAEVLRKTSACVACGQPGDSRASALSNGCQRGPLAALSRNATQLFDAAALLEQPHIPEDVAALLHLYYRVAVVCLEQVEPKLITSLLRIAAAHALLTQMCECTATQIESEGVSVSVVDAVVSITMVEASLSFSAGRNVIGISLFEVMDDKSFVFVEFANGLLQFLKDTLAAAERQSCN